MIKTDKTAKDFAGYIQERYMLEVACGSADFSASASKYAKKVLAVDISQQYIGKRKEALPENAFFLQADASCLDMEDGTFDVVVFHNCLAHLDEVLEAAIFEAARVTLTGGNIIFVASWKIDLPYFELIKQSAKKLKFLMIDNEINIKEYSALVYYKLPE